jgi:hypothetical protein
MRLLSRFVACGRPAGASLGCHNTVHLQSANGLAQTQAWTAICISSHWRTFAMAWLMSLKMLLRVSLGSDSRCHTLTGTACSVPSRDRSWSLFKICIAQRHCLLLDCQRRRPTASWVAVTLRAHFHDKSGVLRYITLQQCSSVAAAACHALIIAPSIRRTATEEAPHSASSAACCNRWGKDSQPDTCHALLRMGKVYNVTHVHRLVRYL